MKYILSIAYLLSCFLTAQCQTKIPTSRAYKQVTEKFVDSIFSFQNENFVSKLYQFVEANINEAEVDKISFTAGCCGPIRLYDGRVYMYDTVNWICYSLTNENIAGINKKTKIGNDVTAIEVRVNGKQYSFPIRTYLKGEQQFELVRSCNKAPKKIEIKGRLVKEIRGHKVVPLLLVDDISRIPAVMEK